MQMFQSLMNLSILRIVPVLLVFTAVIPDTFAANLNKLRGSVIDSVVGDTVDTGGWITSSTGPVSYDSYPSVSTPVLVSTPYPNNGDIAGYADFSLLKAQAYSSASGAVVNRNASIDVETSYSVTVIDNPFFNVGDPVSLNVSFRLDGILNSGAGAGDITGSVGVGADLTIINTDIDLDCGSSDGCYSPKLLDFSAGASTASYGTNGYTDNGWSWNLRTRNELDELIDQQSDSGSSYIGPNAACSGPVCNDISFDTGILSTTIETTVGATLDINASLGIFAQVWNYAGDESDGGYGSADFFDTFGLVITPITEGVELDYGDITPANYDLGATVPVPAAVWLFGSGLIGLVGVARRKKS